MDSMLLLLLMFALMLGVMFLMSGRQRKRMREQQEKIARLGVGDEVRTHSGFYGLIVEEVGDTVVLESEDGAQLRWARAAIAGPVEPTSTEVPDDASELAEPAADADVEETPAPSDRDGIPGVTARDDDRR